MKRSRAGNLLLSAAITASGNNYEKIRLFFKFLRIGMLHPSSHVAVQARHVAPVIVGHFETIISENIQKYIGKHIIVTGNIMNEFILDYNLLSSILKHCSVMP